LLLSASNVGYARFTTAGAGFQVRMSNKFNARLQIARRATLAAAALCALSACATVQPVSMVDPATALNGHDLDTALNLYGQYADHIQVNGRYYYVWRRTLFVDQTPRACEMRAEVAYRSLIRATFVEGDQGACQAFWIKYSGSTETARAKKAAAKAEKAALAKPKVAKGCPNCRPVGAPPPVDTAAVGRQGR
jgi:hypothetical protein